MQSLETKVRGVDLLSALQAAEVLGISRRALINRVEAGTIEPIGKLPGRTGSFLFDRSYIEAVAAREREDASALADSSSSSSSSSSEGVA